MCSMSVTNIIKVNHHPFALWLIEYFILKLCSSLQYMITTINKCQMSHGCNLLNNLPDWGDWYNKANDLIVDLLVSLCLQGPRVIRMWLRGATNFEHVALVPLYRTVGPRRTPCIQTWRVARQGQESPNIYDFPSHYIQC